MRAELAFVEADESLLRWVLHPLVPNGEVLRRRREVAVELERIERATERRHVDVCDVPRDVRVRRDAERAHELGEVHRLDVRCETERLRERLDVDVFQMNGAARELDLHARAANDVVANRDVGVDGVGEVIAIDANVSRRHAPAHFGELHARRITHVEIDTDPTFHVGQLRETRRSADRTAQTNVTARLRRQLPVFRELHARMRELELESTLIIFGELARRRRQLAWIQIRRALQLEATHGDVVGREPHASVERAHRVFVERRGAVCGLALADDVALAGAQRDLERRPAPFIVVRLHVEIERVRLNVHVVDGEVHVAVGDRERVERKMNRRAGFFLRLRLEREVHHLAVFDDDARVRRFDVDLIDEQLAAHEREKSRAHRGAVRGEHRPAAIGGLDAHVGELERERPQMNEHLEMRDDALIVKRLRGLARRPITRVRRANEPNARERQNTRERQNHGQNARERTPHARPPTPLRKRRKARHDGRGAGHAMNTKRYALIARSPTVWRRFLQLFSQ